MVLNKYPPSKHQVKIYNWITNGTGNARILAVAGSGKTTTLIGISTLIPKNVRSIFVAFNKNIATYLRDELPEHIEAKTLHAVGFSMFSKNLGGRPEVDKDGDKLNDLVKEQMEYYKNKDDYSEEIQKEIFTFFKRIIPLIKNTLIDYTNLEQVMNTAAEYNINGIEVDEKIMESIKHIMNKNNANLSLIDFDDMIYLPVVHNFTSYTYDWVLVDESQDLNKTQFELIKKLCKKTTRVVAVGDPRQSIYAFRGADVNSMDNFKNEFNTIDLPLSICYRCPKSHIRLAQEIVPEIEYCETKEEGEIENLPLEQVIENTLEGDLVLCRTNAPLIKMAFAFIRRGKKAVVRGRDIGQNLIKLLEKYKAKDLEELYLKLEKFRKLQTDKLDMIAKGTFDRKKKGSLIASVEGVETIFVIMEDCETLQDVKIKIETIFSDQRTGIVCSSIHKAKGLEADNVVIVNRENMPHPMANTDKEIEQEHNILYVALTRAKKKLIFVNELIK